MFVKYYFQKNHEKVTLFVDIDIIIDREKCVVYTENGSGRDFCFTQRYEYGEVQI